MPLLETVQLPTGVTLPYVEQGERSGVPVVFLHGVADSWRSFEPVLPHLPPFIHAFAVTQRGHGDASCPPSGYRTRDFAADIAALIDVLALKDPVIVGHSMGSVNAMRFAIDNRDRLRALALIGAFAGFRNNPAVVEFYESSIMPLMDPIDPGFVREFQESTLSKPLSPGYFDTVVGESLKVPARVWKDAFAGFLEDDFATEVEQIHAPTWIVWGDRDNFCPRSHQDELLARIPNARLSVYERTGHAVHWEDPIHFAVELGLFVAGMQRRSH